MEAGGSAAWQRRDWNMLMMHGLLSSLIVLDFIRPASGLDCGDLDAFIASHDRFLSLLFSFAKGCAITYQDCSYRFILSHFVPAEVRYPHGTPSTRSTRPCPLSGYREN